MPPKKPKAFIQLLCLCVFLACYMHGKVFAQSDSSRYPSYSIKPLGLPLRLNADFGEFRSSHFHSGLDFYTLRRTGLKVFSVGDGYVSRIKVQSGGYGQALYITHPDGYVSVYGHLSAYAEPIASYLKTLQYKNQEYELDKYLNPSEIPVKKEQLVAYSGDTGFSGGPHLHFEFRDARTEEIINPLLFGIPVQDNTFPTIKGVYLFRFHEQGKIRQVEPAYFLPAVRCAPGRYQLKAGNTIFESGKIVLGVLAFDTQSASPNPNGVYSVSLSKDGMPIFKSRFERFGFNQTRGINSYLHYFLLKNKDIPIQVSYREAGNTLKLYSNVINRGVITMNSGAHSRIVYDVGDVAGNVARLEFYISAGPKELASRKLLEESWQASFENRSKNPAGGVFPTIPFDRDTTVYINKAEHLCKSTEAIMALTCPSGSIFDNMLLPFTLAPSFEVNRACTIGDKEQAIKDSLCLGLKAPEHAKSLYKFVLRAEQGNYLLPSLKNGWIWFWIKEFGSFSLELDESPPQVYPVRNYDKSRLKEGEAMRFRIRDRQSGIGPYRAELDGRWTLCSYDEKTRSLSVTFEEGISSGDHSFRLSVEDKVGNRTLFDCTFNK